MARVRFIPVARITALLLAIVLLIASGVGVTTRVQGATPGATWPTSAYPELVIRRTNAGFDLPARVPAGRYLVTLDNTTQNNIDAQLMRLPAGKTLADAQAGFATHDPGPAWFYQATFAGGPGARPGGTGQVIADLTPGTWVVLQPDAPLPGQTFTVTAGSDPAAAPTPVADLMIKLQEYAFVGLPPRVTAGHHVWQVTNIGTQPHFLLVEKLPQPLTMAQVMTLMSLPPNATPPPGLPNPNQFAQVGGDDVLSPGRTGWAIFDLPPGNYIAVCFVPDAKTGQPHAMLGMVTIFTVA